MTHTPDIDAFEGSAIPAYMHGAITRYVEHRIPPGSFLTAIICNDLREAVARADDENSRCIPAYVRWFYNNAPCGCWGSPAKYQAWLRQEAEAA